MDLALNNLQGLICHKTQPTNNQDLDTQALYGPWLLSQGITKSDGSRG